VHQVPFNRLLDYRSLDQLSRMNDSDRAALLREILEQPPSEAAWQAVWELFASWPSGESRDTYLTVANQAMAAWPDRLRFVHSSNALLYEGRHLSMLTRLVRSIEVYRREQQGTAELLAIASSEYASDLTYLSIHRSEIDSRAWRSLAESPHLSNLRHLHVARSVLGVADVQRLFQSTTLRQLTCLKLVDVGVQPRLLEAIRQTMALRELCAIDLSANGIGDEGVTTLSRSAWLRQIQRLALRDDYIRADGARKLLSSPFSECIQEIDLTGNRLTDSERAELVALATASSIRLIT
jgi:hypothetical protein